MKQFKQTGIYTGYIGILWSNCLIMRVEKFYGYIWSYVKHLFTQFHIANFIACC